MEKHQVKSQAVTIYDGRPFAAATADSSTMDVIAEALAPGEKLGFSDFPKIQMPGAGGLVWSLPNGEVTKEFEAIILHRQPVRAYWSGAYEDSSNEPPDCSSLDSIQGVGTPGGACNVCPLSAYGTSMGKGETAGRGQACRQITRLFLLLPDSLLPVLLALPPSSYQRAMQYVVRLASTEHRYSSVVTAISLEESKNATGLTYSRAALRLVAPLDPEQAARIAAYRGEILPFLTGGEVNKV